MLLVVAILVLLNVVIFFSGLSRILYDFILGIAQGEVKLFWISLFGYAVFIVSTVVFGVLGYNLARKKNRNHIAWTILCLLFNLWSFVLLYFLPPKDRT